MFEEKVEFEPSSVNYSTSLAHLAVGEAGGNLLRIYSVQVSVEGGSQDIKKEKITELKQWEIVKRNLHFTGKWLCCDFRVFVIVLLCLLYCTACCTAFHIVLLLLLSSSSSHPHLSYSQSIIKGYVTSRNAYIIL